MRSPRSACLAAVVVLAVAVVCASTSSAADGPTGSNGLTIFTVATGVQFINTADDRARGAKNNPFDATANKLRPRATSAGNGPFAGDVVVFSFDLYGKLPGKKSIGSASYTCYFNYARHALCQAFYQLARGTVTAAGPVDFNTTSFTLVLTGGTRSYLAVRGQASSHQAGPNAQRVSFQVLP